MLLFAISNGYLTSLLMMRVITDESLLPSEVDIAATLSILYLTIGLVVGAAFSFVSSLSRYAGLLLIAAQYQVLLAMLQIL